MFVYIRTRLWRLGNGTVGRWETAPLVVGIGTIGNWEGSGRLWEWVRSPEKKNAEMGPSVRLSVRPFVNSSMHICCWGHLSHTATQFLFFYPGGWRAGWYLQFFTDPILDFCPFSTSPSALTLNTGLQNCFEETDFEKPGRNHIELIRQ